MQRQLKRSLLQVYKRALRCETSIILRTMIRRTMNKLKRGAYDMDTEALVRTIRTHISLATDGQVCRRLRDMISLFEDEETSTNSQTTDEAPFYRVHSIIGVRFNGNAREYLVHWDGYDSSQDSWEPHETLIEDDCNDMVGKFHRRVVAK